MKKAKKLIFTIVLLCGFFMGTTLSVSCPSPDFTFDEGPNGNRCKSNCDFDGKRTCSYYGWCLGTSRVIKPKAPPRPSRTSGPGDLYAFENMCQKHTFLTTTFSSKYISRKGDA
jgi:hypothetical protein